MYTGRYNFCTLYCIFLLVAPHAVFAQHTLWESLGPYGSSVADLLTHADRVLFAATDEGVYRSTDGGTTWELAITGHAITSLSSDDQQKIIAGAQGSVLTSADGGFTWSEHTIPASVSDVAIGRDGTFYAGTLCEIITSTGSKGCDVGGGISRSTDQGDTWQHSGDNNWNIDALASTDSGRIYALVDGALYLSDDTGLSWLSFNFDLPYVTSLTTTSDDTIFAATEEGVYRLNRDMTPPEKAGLQGVLIEQVYATSGQHLYAFSFNGLGYYTMEGDTSWVTFSFPDVRVTAFARNEQGHLLIGSHDFGLYRLDAPGSSWQSVGMGLPSARITSLTAGPDGPVYAAISDQGVRKRHGNTTWDRIGLEDLNVRDLLFARDGALLAATSDGIFRLTQDASWLQVTDIPYLTDNLVAGPDGMLFASQHQTGVLRSFDEGRTWEATSLDTQIGSLAVAPNGTVYAALSAGIQRSRDNGETWETVPTPFSSALVLSLDKHATLYAGTHSEGVFRLSDQGETWEQTGLVGEIIYDLVADPTGGMFASMLDHGVFYLANQSKAWKPVNQGLTNTTVYALLVDEDGFLLAGTKTRGVFRTIVEAVALPHERRPSINTVQFDPIYPNPFQGKAAIMIDLPHSSEVSIHIFDVLGREIATLLNGTYPAGRHHLRWDASSLPSGVYLCLIKADNHTETQRVVLLK